MALAISEEFLYDAINYRLPHYHEAIPFILAWSHKSGCTSTLQWFFWHTGDLQNALNYENRTGLVVHNYERFVFKADINYRYDLGQAILAERPIINFLRCPYERVWSSYLHIHNRHFVTIEQNNQYNKSLEFRKEVQAFVYGEDVSVEYPISFTQYLEYLDERGFEDIDRHHSPQYTPLFDLPTVRHYRLEDFDLLAPRLEQEFGLKDSADDRQHFLKTHHVPKKPMGRRVAMRLMALGVPLNPSERFQIPKVNRKMLEGSRFEPLIQKLFVKDIELYDAIS
ncbi:MAG: hypothetical protein KC422_25965 [Trueperaceae bacterium]|nr:hypothetical protein [Trueperaceae bacterium]